MNMELVVPRSLPCGNSWSLIGGIHLDNSERQREGTLVLVVPRLTTPPHFLQFKLRNPIILSPGQWFFCNWEPKMFLETIPSLSGSHIPHTCLLSILLLTGHWSWSMHFVEGVWPGLLREKHAEQSISPLPVKQERRRGEKWHLS